MITNPDALITNALAGVPSVYFVASFHERLLYRAAPERVSLTGACFAEAGPKSHQDTPTQIMQREVMRLYAEGLVSPVQRRTEIDGIVTIEYIAQPRRLRVT